ncbi:alpha/beta hydrolase family protein [Frankia sp. QA3]|uniref:alpha/beta hydrolase n=1 Tax=Frankia sp. QA3 TaxID=710111 RepID=UPI0002E2E229|nr:alpha/beta hydrolase-fold protein [Frankia sp. QA3]
MTCVTSPVAGAARLVDVTIHSTAMNADETVRLLLPTDYDAQPDRTWPVLYLLHGGASSSDEASNHTDWTAHTDVENRTAGRNVIVVMPDAGSAGWYSDWVDDPARWETFHTVEVRCRGTP